MFCLMISNLFLLTNSHAIFGFFEGDLDKAYDYFEAENYESALDEFQLLAENDNPYAQLMLARMYNDGNGTEKNMNLHFKWINAAANNFYNGIMDQSEDYSLEHANLAMYSLGYCYTMGLGTDQNFAKAFKWFKKSADNNHLNGMYAVAKMYYEGTGTEKNMEASFIYTKMRAESEKNNDPDAYNQLAFSYYDGIVTSESKEDAFYWFTKAAEMGSITAMKYLVDMNILGEGVEKNDKDAFKYLKLIAESEKNNDPAIYYELGKYYFMGTGTDKDEALSSKWTLKAANANHSRANFLMGHNYFHGIGIDQDEEKAIKYLEIAAKENVIESQMMLGALYFEMEQKIEDAFYWFEKAAKLGDPVANKVLADAYVQGIHYKKDLNEAIKWSSRAECIEMGVQVSDPEMISCTLNLVNIKIDQIEREEEKRIAQKKLEIEKERLIAEQRSIQIEKARLEAEENALWISRQQQLRNIANESFTMGAALLGW